MKIHIPMCPTTRAVLQTIVAAPIARQDIAAATLENITGQMMTALFTLSSTIAAFPIFMEAFVGSTNVTLRLSGCVCIVLPTEQTSLDKLLSPLDKPVFTPQLAFTYMPLLAALVAELGPAKATYRDIPVRFVDESGKNLCGTYACGCNQCSARQDAGSHSTAASHFPLLEPKYRPW